MLGIEGEIETGLRQRQANEFALAGAVFDQEDGGVRHHIRRTSAGNVLGSKRRSMRRECIVRAVSYDDKGNKIGDGEKGE